MRDGTTANVSFEDNWSTFIDTNSPTFFVIIGLFLLLGDNWPICIDTNWPLSRPLLFCSLHLSICEIVTNLHKT